ncbi:ABC transporter permease [Aestuariivirga litoralis]|uniref:ABC transporter permease n=1 Tax=Aestuariivirga litoralis TaxID=2650924 RepID=UPI001AEEED78|nr:ABC transporter permease [Aestuariivirga litoralis]MBG1231760.1 ABC transporter permease [Aestuariivirga litoralis]
MSATTEPVSQFTGPQESRAGRMAQRFGLFLLTLAITFLGLTAVTFCIGRFVPVDPVIAIVGDHASAETYAATRIAIGLDKPIYMQFLIYLNKVLHGDLGQSVMTSHPVLEDLASFFPATIELATVGILVGVLIGVPAGVVAGACKDRWPDQVIRIFSLFGYSTPVFWLGLVGLFLFYGKLGWVAGTGRLDVGYDDIVTPQTGILLIDAAIQGEWDVWHNALSHLLLPGALLAYYSLAYIARMTRSFMIEQLSQEYVIAARVKGQSFWGAVWRHAFPNIMVPLITVVGLSYASLLEGAVLTETVFSWPGLGLYITHSLFAADMNAVLGGTLAVGVVYTGINAVCDFLYKIFDPRLRAP